jgi:hypothetical protein
MQAFRFLKFLKLDVRPSVIDDLATKQPNILNFNFLRATRSGLCAPSDPIRQFQLPYRTQPPDVPSPATR